MYRKELKGREGITLLGEQEGARSCYYKCVGMLEAIRKETFIAGMKKRGIQVGVLYDPPLHRMKVMTARYGETGPFPVADRVASRAVSLPMFPSMTRNDVRKVCSAVMEVLR